MLYSEYYTDNGCKMELHIDIEGCYFVTNDGGCSDNFNDVEAAEEALDNGTLRIN